MNKIDAVKALLERGASVLVPNAKGRTVLQVIERAKHVGKELYHLIKKAHEDEDCTVIALVIAPISRRDLVLACERPAQRL